VPKHGDHFHLLNKNTQIFVKEWLLIEERNTKNRTISHSQYSKMPVIMKAQKLANNEGNPHGPNVIVINLFLHLEKEEPNQCKS
jgi:hypothetical protein